MSNAAFTIEYRRIMRDLKTSVDIVYNGNVKKVIALWDTGATSSCISEEVSQSLSMISTGMITMRTPSGQDDRNTYLINVVLPNDVVINDLKVSDSAIGAQGIGMLIGMDVISQGDFAVSNGEGKTTFSFCMPSRKVTDYVKQLKVQDIIGTHGQGKRKKRR